MSISLSLINIRIRLTVLRWALISVIFSALAVATPTVAHHYNLAGQTYLPMHVFVFIAALLFGWRVGLTVGALSPLVSYAISGMPLVNVLPLIVSELMVYGFVAGWLKERMFLPTWLSLLSAMVAGRLILMPVAAVLGPMPAFAYIGQAIRLGWPGILIQITAIPVLISFIQPHIKKYFA